MRTIKFKLLGVLATMLFGAIVSYGQSVYYSESEGGVVIDCTMMPAGTVLAVDDSQEIERDDWQLSSHNEKDEANKVYPKLVVAMSDLPVSNLPGGGMEWSNAVSAAKDKGEGTNLDDWRLPNQREMMLIWVLRKEIAAADASFVAFNQSDYYWSSTVLSNDIYYRWYVSFGSGDANNDDAGHYYYARAVREIKSE